MSYYISMVKTKIAKQKTLKRNNRRVVYSYMRDHGPLSIAELAKAVNLSRNTIVKTIEHYEKDGFFQNIGKGESTDEGGKRPVLYQFNPLARVACGVEITEDKISVVLTDLTSKIIEMKKEKYSWNTPLEKVLLRVKDIYSDLLQENSIEESKIIGIGFGFHGIVNFTSGTLLTSPHNPVWGENVNLAEKVRGVFPGILVYVDNKIRFQAYAELIHGNWGTWKDIIVMDAGAGAITGVIMQNSLRRGHHSLAGHIGHMVVNPMDEEICKCGGRGCFEVLISTRRLLKRAREGYSEHRDSILFRNTSESHTAEIIDTLSEQDVFAAADKGDTFARELLDEVIRWFALGLHNIALMYDPDIIVFQGKYGKGGDYFLSEIRKRVSEISLLKVKQPLQIEYSKISEHPGAQGAAAYVVSEFVK